jgi:hypothetical protein
MLALVLALVVAWAASASAAELKVRGAIIADSQWGDGGYASFWAAKDGGNYQDKHNIEERARIMWDFVANENLKFTMQTQIGAGMWGQGGFGLGQGDGATGKSTALRVREAYMDFNVPDSDVNVKAGYMLMYLPAANPGGSPILNDESAAVAMVTVPVIKDTVSVLVGYARLWDSTNANNTANNAGTGTSSYGLRDELDAAILAVPVTWNKIEATPWMVYGWGGKNSLTDAQFGSDRYTGLLSAGPQQTGNLNKSFQKDLTVWWAGLATTVKMFDPIVFGFDYNYGSVSGAGSVDGAGAPWDSKNVNNRAGWYVDTFIRYTGLDMVKPELFFAYGSGEDSDPTNGSERMPLLYNGGYALGVSWWTGGSNFGQTDMGGDSRHSGFWALGLSLNDITFMEKLSHDFMFMYAQGTNSADLLRDANTPAYSWGGAYNAGHFLTTKDHFFEFDLNTKYKIYDELTAIMELGYINMNTNKDLWNDYMYGVGSARTYKASDAYKVAMGLKYAF